MRKTQAEYDTTRTTVVVSMRLAPADAELLRSRAAGAGVGPAEYIVTMLRGRKAPEVDLRQVAGLAESTAAIKILIAEMRRVRSEIAGGFGLLKQAFISSPDRARDSKTEIDETCKVARAIIRDAEKTIERVERSAAGPLDDLAQASTAILSGHA